MKTTKKYAALSLLTAGAVLAMSMGSLGFAQTVNPVTCSVALSSVNTNQPVIVTAAGGDGANYTWSGTNLTTTNPTGAQFAVSYPATGTYTVNVSSGGQTGSCTVNVTGSPVAGTLMCSPAVQTVALGTAASVSATGGNGTYVWSSPDISINNPNGSGFSASYGSTGLKTLTVTSNGTSTSCAINVVGNPNGTTPVTPPVVTPGLPDTGGGFGK